MRTLRTSLAMVLATVFALQAWAMSAEQSRNEAWFLTDKMAHELRLSSYQWDDVYEVNYDYFRALGSVYSSYTNIERSREQKLMYILTAAQWQDYRRLSYFNTPAVAMNGHWSFSIYTRYDRDRFFDRSHRPIFAYSGNRNNWADYYRNRHVTQRNNPASFNHNAGNHNNNAGNWNNNAGNWNRNKGAGNHNVGGNNNRNQGTHIASSGNAGNRGNNNMGSSNHNVGNRNNNGNTRTVASRTPNSSSSHVTQGTSRRH